MSKELVLEKLQKVWVSQLWMPISSATYLNMKN